MPDTHARANCCPEYAELSRRQFMAVTSVATLAGKAGDDGNKFLAWLNSAAQAEQRTVSIVSSSCASRVAASAAA